MPLEINIMKILTKATILQAIQWDPAYQVTSNCLAHFPLITWRLIEESETPNLAVGGPVAMKWCPVSFPMIVCAKIAQSWMYIGHKRERLGK